MKMSHARPVSGIDCPRQEAVVALLLQDIAFMDVMQVACSMTRSRLETAGFELGAWGAAGRAPELGERRIGYRAAMNAHGLCEQPLELQFVAEVEEGGAVRVSLRLSQQTEDGPLVAGVLVASTPSLGLNTDAQMHLEQVLNDSMAFVEGDARGRAVRAIRTGKTFFKPVTWVPEAVDLLLAGLSPS